MKKQKFTKEELRQAFLDLFANGKEPKGFVHIHEEHDPQWGGFTILYGGVFIGLMSVGLIIQDTFFYSIAMVFGVIAALCLLVSFFAKKSVKLNYKEYLEHKYVSRIEGTKEYELILGGVSNNEEDSSEELEDKDRLQKQLLELWMLAFDKKGLIDRDAPPKKPIKEQIALHLDERKNALAEFESTDEVTSNECQQKN